MAAPTSIAEAPKNLCQRRAVHTGSIAIDAKPRLFKLARNARLGQRDAEICSHPGMPAIKRELCEVGGKTHSPNTGGHRCPAIRLFFAESAARLSNSR